MQAALQRRNGGNQSDLARAAGCTPQLISKYLLGLNFPRRELLEKIADYLDVTPEYLQYGTPMIPPNPEPPQYLATYVTTDEMVLLHHYRESTAAGKFQMQASGIGAEKRPAHELPAKPD